ERERRRDVGLQFENTLHDMVGRLGRAQHRQQIVVLVPAVRREAQVIGEPRSARVVYQGAQLVEILKIEWVKGTNRKPHAVKHDRPTLERLVQNKTGTAPEGHRV